jgi:hypothetical protein
MAKKRKSKVPDPCKILKIRADEELVAQKTYETHATQPIFSPDEQKMFKEQADEEAHHYAENRRAQIMRGCIR